MLDEEFVAITEDIKEYLKQRNKSPHDHSQEEGQPRISMTISIHQADRQVCGHFLWDLARHIIRDQFKFDFDNTALVLGSQSLLAVDEFEAHHHILLKTFEYFHSSANRSTEIGPYLVRWLPHHLQRLKALDDDGQGQLNDDELVHIAKSLQALFQDGEMLRRNNKNFEGTWWFSHELQILQDWCLGLRDRRAVKKLDGDWKAKLEQTSSPIQGFLGELSKAIAKELVLERNWSVMHAWWWLEEFLAAVSTCWYRRYRGFLTC